MRCLSSIASLLVDLTGRVIVQGKRGSIPPELAAILSRLDLKVEQWLTTMLGHRAMSGTAVGSIDSRTAEANRRGVTWVRSAGATKLFAA